MDDTWWKSAEQLDDDQRAVIKDLAVDEHHLITGPPGSGKTNLLVLRATYLHLLGQHDIVIITYNRTLREFLASGVGRYNFAGDKIRTYVRWGVETLVSGGYKFGENAKENFEERQARISQNLAALAASGSKQNKHDFILIDEAQDYTSEEIKLFRTFGRWIFAAADSNQRIYNEKDGLERLKEFCKVAPRLKYHYRNGRKICRIADALREQLDAPDGLQSTSQYDEAANPSVVEVLRCDSIHDQGRAIAEVLERQLLAYPDERLGVACPRHRELDSIWEVIRKSPVADKAQLQRYADGYEALDPERPICITTLHGTKGMEFRAMHIAGTEYIKKFRDIQKNLIYTGITRAKTSLTILHTAPLPGYLENALGSVRPAPPKPQLNDLFRTA